MLHLKDSDNSRQFHRTTRCKKVTKIRWKINKSKINNNNASFKKFKQLKTTCQTQLLGINN